MDQSILEKLAGGLLTGGMTSGEFLALAGEPTVRRPPSTAELGEVTLDLDRRRRCGFPEVIFGEGKTVATLAKIMERLREEKVRVLVTRVSQEKGQELRSLFPASVYNEVGHTLRLAVDGEENSLVGKVAVVTAGTSDLPVAEEARETLDWMGVSASIIADVGVAGPQRLLARLDDILGSDAVVVVAGMEAALASVVGGHVDCPVIAVPTSIGYGASFGGVAALLGMLNSCAANVTVVNIDAGFKGGYVAGLIARGKQQSKSEIRNPKSEP
ncbi:MAG: nickel pincer cofactor biosynthesis protein LarB [Pirellulaceae bacterium]